VIRGTIEAPEIFRRNFQLIQIRQAAREVFLSGNAPQA
jgi:hypothetical protein